MSTFESDTRLPSDHIKVDTTTYLLARDEDCENAFHSTADFVSFHCLFLKKIAFNFMVATFDTDEHVFGEKSSKYRL